MATHLTLSKPGLSAKSFLPSVSVVIPCYNAAAWLPSTVEHITHALTSAGLTTGEIIIVDDGSTDDSAVVADALVAAYPVRLIRQAWRGRYLARKAGVERATGLYVLFIDTRIHLHADAMSFVVQQLRDHPERQVWNGHVEPAKKGNIIARFGDAITFIGWRRYFKNPRTTSYGLEDFDHYPKGTGIFFAPKTAIIAAMAEFERTTNDLAHSSDDTLLIRILARDYRINLSPHFSCTYFARTTLSQFIKHTYFRGQFFVDGFLRSDTRFFWPLVVFLVASALALLAVVIRPTVLAALLILVVIIWAVEPIIALGLGTPFADALSLFALSPLFAIAYALGIWRAVIRRYGRI